MAWSEIKQLDTSTRHWFQAVGEHIHRPRKLERRMINMLGLGHLERIYLELIATRSMPQRSNQYEPHNHLRLVIQDLAF